MFENNPYKNGDAFDEYYKISYTLTNIFIEHLMQHDIDVLVVSDIHLGSKVSRVGELTKFLQTHRVNRLILNGDIFDGANYQRLQDKDWEFLSLLREMTGNKIEIIWVAGNHDVETKNFFVLIGVKICSEYIFSYHEEKYLVIHGHQFDRFLIKNEKVNDVMRIPYRLLQRIEGKKHGVSRMVKRGYKKWLRLSKRVMRGATLYATQKGVQNVICGHTHHPADTKFHEIRYMNSGSWAESVVSYIEFVEGTVSVQIIE